MLNKAPLNNEIVAIYKQIPKHGDCYISHTLQVVLDGGNVSRRGCLQRKATIIEENVNKKPIAQRKVKKVKVSVVGEEDDENTDSDLGLEDDVNN